MFDSIIFMTTVRSLRMVFKTCPEGLMPDFPAIGLWAHVSLPQPLILLPGGLFFCQVETG
jgi:hypothetical protein